MAEWEALPWWQQRLYSHHLQLEFRNRLQLKSTDEGYDPEAYLSDEEYQQEYKLLDYQFDVEHGNEPMDAGNRWSLEALGLTFVEVPAPDAG